MRAALLGLFDLGAVITFLLVEKADKYKVTVEGAIALGTIFGVLVILLYIERRDE